MKENGLYIYYKDQLLILCREIITFNDEYY
jgi:hypothetical protein